MAPQPNAHPELGDQSEMFREQFFKTMLCRYHPQCKKGAGCPFAHGEKELRGPPDLRKTSICRAWKHGTCPYTALKCEYAHGRRDLRMTPEFRRGCTEKPHGASSAQPRPAPARAQTRCSGDRPQAWVDQPPVQAGASLGNARTTSCKTSFKPGSAPRQGASHGAQVDCPVSGDLRAPAESQWHTKPTSSHGAEFTASTWHAGPGGKCAEEWPPQPAQQEAPHPMDPQAAAAAGPHAPYGRAQAQAMAVRPLAQANTRFEARAVAVGTSAAAPPRGSPGDGTGMSGGVGADIRAAELGGAGLGDTGKAHLGAPKQMQVTGMPSGLGADIRAAELGGAGLGGTGKAHLGAPPQMQVTGMFSGLGADIRAAELGGAGLGMSGGLGVDIRAAELGGASLGGTVEIPVGAPPSPMQAFRPGDRAPHAAPVALPAGLYYVFCLLPVEVKM